MGVRVSLVVLMVAAPALAQKPARPPGASPRPVAYARYPGPFPYPAGSPGFLAYRPFGFAPAFANPPLYGLGYNNFIGPRYGYGYDGAFGGGFGGGYPYPVPFSPPPPPPLVGTSPAVALGPTPDSPLTAQLTLEFPAAVELTVDGQVDTSPGVATDAGVTRTLTTRALNPGEAVTLRVSAEWSQGGRGVEWARAVTLTRGETARLTVARGFPKK